MQLSTHPRDLRKSLAQLLSVITVLTSAYMCYKALAIAVNSPTPVVVVLSGSMEPAFQRGDILFMWNRESRVHTGDIVVYDTDRRDIPIVHRVVRTHESSEKQLVLTKGDNNALDDIDLYGYKKMYLNRQRDINGGVVKAYFPKLGYVTILLTENPRIRMAVVGFAMLTTLFSNE